MLRIVCPECDKPLQVKEDLAGRIIKCPKCEAKFSVPKAKAEIDEVSNEPSDDDGDAEQVAARSRPAPSKRGSKAELGEGDRPRRKPTRNDSDDEEDHPSRPSGSTRKPDKTQSKSRLPWVVALAVMLPILGIACAVTLYFLLRPAPNAPPIVNLPVPPVVVQKPPEAGNQSPPRLSGEINVAELLRGLDSDNELDRIGAAKHLAAMKPTNERPLVVQKLADSVRKTKKKANAVRALEAWVSPTELPVMIDLLLTEKDAFARQDILGFLGKFKDERALKPIMTCLKDSSVSVAASKALRDMGPMAEDEVIAVMKESDSGVRTLAIQVLKDIGTQKSVPVLQDREKNGAPVERANARVALKALQARLAKT